MEITKTARLLKVFYYFYKKKYAVIGIVTAADIVNYLSWYCTVSTKTVCRDLHFLHEAGLIRLYYSQKHKCYLPLGKGFVSADGKFAEPKLPENRTRRLYMEKIIRLCTVMVQLEIWDKSCVDSVNPYTWYKERFPQLSDRTRQRDFKELYAFGYRIEYVRPENGDPGYWYYGG